MGLYAGLVGLYLGLVGDSFGLVGEYAAVNITDKDEGTLQCTTWSIANTTQLLLHHRGSHSEMPAQRQLQHNCIPCSSHLDSSESTEGWSESTEGWSESTEGWSESTEGWSESTEGLSASTEGSSVSTAGSSVSKQDWSANTEG